MTRCRAMNCLGLLLTLIGAAWTMTGCETNAATGRSQLLAMSRDEEIKLGTELSPEFIREGGGSLASPELQAYVANIGRRLAEQTEADNPSLPWEFTLLDSDVINAFAMPGGKVFFSRGLAEKMTNEAQMAFVLGHEIGHVTGKHTNARFAKQAATVGIAAVIGGLLGAAVTEDRTTGAAIGAGAGATVGGVMALSYSRDDETEADQLGMRYMERLGYDLQGAKQVHMILQQAAGGDAPPEMLSTHPASDTRMAEFEKRLAKYYQHTINNPAYSLYEDRFRTQFLAKLPPKKQTKAPTAREMLAGAVMRDAGRDAARRGEALDRAATGAAALDGTAPADLPDTLGDPALWCWHCANR
ncbi:MAG: M48 family metalloprotease [Phycisphaerales bacterium]|jgi:predicted Zn-dependent protease|nr:M48 family metalloprotease [Phycisphaerales bacterium]